MAAGKLQEVVRFDSCRSWLETIMGDDGRRHDPLRWLLYGCSRIYAKIVESRVRRYHHHTGRILQLPRPVISVGNLTTGGTGKTPMTVYLAGLIKSTGLTPVILSRGYGGRAERSGAFVSTGSGPQLPVEVAGDEAYLLSRRLPDVPVVVGRDRHAMGLAAMDRLSPDCFILDDGYQHIQLHRDLNLALIDCRRPFGNRHLLPRGHLREPLTALKRADAVILTRCDLNTTGGLPEVNAHCPGKPVFRSRHRSYVSGRWTAGQSSPAPPRGDLPSGAAVYLFSGIADNLAFQASIAAMGAQLVGVAAFADHHPYTGEDLRKIAAAAEHTGAEVLITTAKDAVRLPHPLPWRKALLVADVALEFADDRFEAYCLQILSRLGGERSVAA
ncbi:MAG: tetraacyldisaccharide 4'-kinase [Desulfosarcinaceae bacterium]|nr:tetraacyldisaccharide 4'-kinase [Desulfosarcinaceae bacterium]